MAQSTSGKILARPYAATASNSSSRSFATIRSPTASNRSIFRRPRVGFELQQNIRARAVDLGQAAQVENDARCPLPKRGIDAFHHSLACTKEQRPLQLHHQARAAGVCQEIAIPARYATFASGRRRSDGSAAPMWTTNNPTAIARPMNTAKTILRTSEHDLEGRYVDFREHPELIES